jgi:chitin disaccharide deacetylase
MRYLIINADGYGFTAGISRAIEECIAFGTVRSISANVNFPHAEGLAPLVRQYPELSVGCHLNPVVGRPVLSPKDIPTLIDDNGEFFYKDFLRRYLSGRMRLAELRAEMLAQVERARALVGEAFSHVDFHMGLHRLPGLYRVFLDVAEHSGARRIRTHWYLGGMEHRCPRLQHSLLLCKTPARLPTFVWNLWLRRIALRHHLAMPDHRVAMSSMRPDTITVQNYLRMLNNLPHGFNEFVVHPGYVDDDLKRWSTYIEQRPLELQVLLSSEFRDALGASDMRLAGYRDIPLHDMRLRR